MSDELTERIRSAAEAYYQGEPIISDEEYDALLDQQNTLQGEEAQEVAGGFIPEDRKVALSIPMLSLQKVYAQEELERWLSKLPDSQDVIVEPKWDGMAVQITFEGEEIVLAATRGNGTIGERVTETVKAIPGIYDERDKEGPRKQIIVGEIIADHSAVQYIKDEYGIEYTSTRSAVAGALNRRDDLGPQIASRFKFINHVDQNAQNVLPSGDIDGIMKAVQRIEEMRMSGGSRLSIDGAVVKVADLSVRESMGTSNFAPRWSIAYKFDAEEKETAIREVNWYLGRTGAVTPVATFDPVYLVDSRITNSTLHNIDIFEAFEMREGDTIKVKRAGDVIPYISGVVKHSDGKPFQVPTECPNCGSMLERVGPKILCTNTCNLQGQLTYALASLGADGVGPGIASDLIEYGIIDATGIVEALRQALNVTTDQLLQVPRYGDQRARNVVESLKTLRDAEMASWIVSVGIKGIGWSYSRALADLIGQDRNVERITESALWDLEGFGQSRINVVLDGLPKIRSLFEMLEQEGVEPWLWEPEEVSEDTEWTGRNVVLTGTFPEGVTRSQAIEWLEARGANIQGSVNSKTDLLIAGEKAGSKLTKATELNILVESAEELVERMSS